MKQKLLCAFGALAALWASQPTSAQAAKASSCQLGNGVKHIVYLQFDNVHLMRDSANVPSDLEQIPSLMSFLTDNGVVLTNHHTPLLAKTSVDIITAMTGNYGENFGFAVGNTFGFFDPTKAPHFQPSFAYWTDMVNEGSTASPAYVPQMVDQRGKIHPAPWVPFTRAGCDVGAFSIVNLEFENTTTDIDNVFGATSAQHNENLSNPAKAAADFEGVALHCSQGSPLCKASPNAVADVLTDEPGGYTGYNALFGNAYVAPVINNGAGYVLDLDGKHIADASNPPNDGFPGFNPTPSQALGYAAQMLEAGVPVVYLYVEDAHDNHNYPGAPTNPDGVFGPGEAGYEYQLKAFDAAFTKFFARLAADGITPANTVFAIGAEEGDHFAGATDRATPSGCDGVNVACTYPSGAKGYVTADLSRVYETEAGNATPFSVRTDDAPSVYINGAPPPTSSVTRALETQAATLKGYDPIIGGDAPVMNAMADPAELALLHMISHDPARTPSFILFGDYDFYFSASGSTSPCTPAADAASCFVQTRNGAWTHGNFQDVITNTWFGIAGRGVKKKGMNGDLYTDHADIRPTLLALAGLKDDYAHDGRVLFEFMRDEAKPAALQYDAQVLSELAQSYKAINAPNGPLGVATLTQWSTAALAGNASAYSRLEARIANVTARRNDIAGQMISILENAAFLDEPINLSRAEGLIVRAQALLAEVQ